MTDISLENHMLEAVFDKETGALLSLVGKKTGWKVQRRRELGLSFRMLVPLPGRRNNQVLGGKQSSPRVESDPDNRQITVTWEGLHSEHGGALDITFSTIITLTDDGLTFEADVRNGCPHTIEAISWPCMGDLSCTPGENRLNWMALNFGNGKSRTLFPNFTSQRGYWGTDYPIQIDPTSSSPFILIDSGREGLYAGYHDTTREHLVQFTFELKPGYERRDKSLIPPTDTVDGHPVHIEFHTTHLPFLSSGESGRLHAVVLQPYVGTWHRGADCYKTWRKTWYSPPPTPDWAREVHSWHQIHINSPEDELRCPYKDLVQYGKDCVKHGVKAIQLVGWTDKGQDRGNPSHDIDPRLGTWEELRDAIGAIHDMGVKVILFNKYTWSDRSEEWFRRELVKYAAMDPYGDYYVTSGYQYQTPTQYADINTRRLVPMCMCSEEWREIAANEFKKGIELGAAGMLYDECFHHGNAQYCFDARHGHHVPVHVYAGDALLEREFREIARELNPNYLFSGEACHDLQFRHYSIAYMRIEGDHIPLPRYVAPDAGIMVAVTGLNDRHVINQALLFRYILSYEPRNFKGRLGEMPRTMEYGRKVDALRKHYKAYLWDAEFRHTVGAEVTADGKPYEAYNYSVFLNRETGKRAVGVVNRDDTKSMEVCVTLVDRSSALVLATPEAPDPVATDGTATLPPLSAVVVMER